MLILCRRQNVVNFVNRSPSSFSLSSGLFNSMNKIFFHVFLFLDRDGC